MQRDYQIPDLGDTIQLKQINSSFHKLHQGYQLLYQKGILDTVFKYKNFKGNHKFGICFSMNLNDLLGLLGQPKNKKGGGIVPIQIQYPSLGLSIVFNSKNWSNIAKIDYFYYYKRIQLQYCATCIQKVINGGRCSRCKLIYYCSNQCQRKHWKMHKSYCKEFNQS